MLDNSGLCDLLRRIAEGRLQHSYVNVQDQVYGPLVDGMVVSRSVLASLVRATAINAGRMNREGYTPFYKQRAQCVSMLRYGIVQFGYVSACGAHALCMTQLAAYFRRYITNIVQRYKLSITFEEFMETLVCPATTAATAEQSTQ